MIVQWNTRGVLAAVDVILFVDTVTPKNTASDCWNDPRVLVKTDIELRPVFWFRPREIIEVVE
jgi:hypothetical protein